MDGRSVVIVNILRTRKLTDLPHLNLYRADYEDRHGDPKQWIFASRQDPPRLVSEEWAIPDAVVIVPYHIGRRELVVIEEFRVALGGYQYGFPAGLVDAGETIADTCRRELFEETGLSLGRILRQSPPVLSSSGITDETVSMVFVECDGTPSSAANEGSEDIRVVFVEQRAALAMCRGTDRHMDVKTWIVLSAFAQFGRL
jgi:ADP-ribose pyrophosphatase